MKTLFISDLDGTLLTPAGELSTYTKDSLNYLLDQGMNLTFATARTASTALKIIEDIRLRLPVIFMNGVAVYDRSRQRYIEEYELHPEQAEAALLLLARLGVPAFIYAIIDNRLFCYSPPGLTPSMQKFRSHRELVHAKVFTPIESYSELIGQKLIYVNVIGPRAELLPIYEAFQAIEGLEILFYEDVYEDDWFLEIHLKGVSKGTAVTHLKEELDIEELVVFGDNLNDLPMFQVADFRYAVANGKEPVRALADRIIGSNTEDAVAKELLKIWERKALT